MQITLHTKEWGALRKFIERRADDDRLFEFMEDCPIVSAMGDSAIFNCSFGGVFNRCSTGLSSADAETLVRFISTFCTWVGDGQTPMDLNIPEVAAVMSPETLRGLVELPGQVDRRHFRALVRQAIADGKESVRSVGAFFDYLDGWHRAYRFAVAEGRGCVIMMG